MRAIVLKVQEFNWIPLCAATSETEYKICDWPNPASTHCPGSSEAQLHKQLHHNDTRTQ